MRITNKMMTNNMLHNINTNKNNMTNLENKYASGMAIQKPSDDPIVAVRALKLRTNLSELNQYYEKNIPDAMSWMDVTESALSTTSELITEIHTYCNQGANDPLAVSERESIAKNLVALKEQIYSEGNSNYAGRFVFTGYKTSTPLVFETPETQTEYTITEDIDASAIDISEKVINGYDPADIESLTAATAGSLAAATPEKNTIYRIRLSYDDLKTDGDITLKIPKLDSKGNYELDPVTGERQYEDEIDKSGMTVTNSSDLDAYKGNDDIVFLEDTGEIILSQAKYEEWRNSKFEVTYEKDSFEKNELRPEHYFTCTAKDLTITDPAERDAKAINYTVEDQQIAYEVNFNQRLAINVQGRDAFRHSLGRSVDDIVKAIDDVNAVNNSIATVDKLLESTTDDTQKANLTKIKNTLDEERKMKEAVLRKAFGSGLTAMDNEENTVNAATSDIGTRYRRLELTQDRLATQQVEFTDLLSQNEDADLVDTIVNYNAANTVYNASLQAAGKVVKNSLLDFL